MKRLFFFFAFGLLALNTFAVGEWRTEITPADELLGWSQDFTSHIYEDSVGFFVWRSDQTDQFCIISHKIFDTEVQAGRAGELLRVGIYDDSGKLLDHFVMWLGKWNNRGTKLGTYNLGVMSNPTGQDIKVKKIMQTLSRPGGYVRFACSTADDGLFDFRVYPNPLWFVGIK